MTLVIFWTVLLPVSYWTGWLQSKAFISVLSIVALILSSGAWWVAARVAKRQREDADVSEVLTLLRSVSARLEAELDADAA